MPYSSVLVRDCTTVVLVLIGNRTTGTLREGRRPMLQHLTIPRGPIELAADLYMPDDIDETTPLRAVVLATPGSSVKEQIGANYASRLAARGIAALVFDPAHQGQSGGEPRDLEDPYRRS